MNTHPEQRVKKISPDSPIYPILQAVKLRKFDDVKIFLEAGHSLMWKDTCTQQTVIEILADEQNWPAVVKLIELCDPEKFAFYGEKFLNLTNVPMFDILTHVFLRANITKTQIETYLKSLSSLPTIDVELTPPFDTFFNVLQKMNKGGKENYIQLMRCILTRAQLRITKTITPNSLVEKGSNYVGSRSNDRPYVVAYAQEEFYQLRKFIFEADDFDAIMKCKAAKDISLPLESYVAESIVMRTIHANKLYLDVEDCFIKITVDRKATFNQKFKSKSIWQIVLCRGVLQATPYRQSVKQ